MRTINIDYFYLKRNNKVIKEFEGCYSLVLSEKSLFEFFRETEDILFILYPFVFIYLFNVFTFPIVENPNNYNPNEDLDDFINPFTDFIFSYANSFLYVQIWLINYIRSKELSKIDEVKTNILNELEKVRTDIKNKLDEEKKNDEDNTYCEVIDNCRDGSCGCKLHHYIQSWDNLKSYIDDRIDNYKKYIEDEFNDLVNYTNMAFDNLVNYTIQLFQIRLFWSFLLIVFFVKFPYLLIKDKCEVKKKELSKMDKILLYIYEKKRIKKHILIKKVKNKLDMSENAILTALWRLKQRGYISYDKKYIWIQKAGIKRAEYLRGIYEKI